VQSSCASGGGGVGEIEAVVIRAGRRSSGTAVGADRADRADRADWVD